MKLCSLVVAALVITMTVGGCFFTGVENTARVTDKEVNRVITEIESRQPSSSLSTQIQPLKSWRVGKRFHVVDDQVLMFFDQMGGQDSLHLQGQVVTFAGLSQSPSLLQRQAVDVTFDYQGHKLVYHTGRPLEEIPDNFTIPLLIDLDMVQDVNRQIAGRAVWVKTSIWYDPLSEQMRKGRQLVPVVISRVEPGNKVMPLKVVFTIPGGSDSAAVWMSQPGAVMPGRDFDSMFALSNPRDNYPSISDATWTLIQQGMVTNGMTKEECRLAMGPPKRTAYVPDQTGMREYWYYDGAAYLYFVDGRLKEFRK
ncbi:MAG: hypothetical protein IKR25_05630 [Muribaculaceae bacterium]|nr:hypothetical protein [Muribaculaceae bacterium]